MKTRFFLFILALIFIYSCDDSTNNQNYTDTTKTSINVDNSFHQENIDTLNNYIVLDKIKELPFDLLPYPVAEFFKNNPNSKLDLFDYFSAGFQIEEEYEFYQTKIQYLKPYCGKEILGIFAFKKDTSGYTNYFLFLEKVNNNWTNISQYILSERIIDFLITELSVNIEYKKAKKMKAYVSGKSNEALLFDFSNKSKIFVYKNNNWLSIGQIGFVNGKIDLLKRETNTNGTKMLSSNELDLSKRFTNLSQAIEDSTNAYILDLTSLGVSVLDTNILQLKRLQILILEDNYLSILPQNIWQLNNLQVLRCNTNKLTSLPENIGQLSNLEEISATDNELTYLPLSLAEAYNLKVLNFSNNNISSIVLDFSNLTELAVLNLSDNELKTIPTSIGNLKNLISLDISNNPIVSLPNQIYQLTNLNYIDISKTNIPDSQIVKLMDINPDLTIIMD